MNTEFRNIHPKYGDTIAFDTLEELALAIECCGYILPENGLRENIDYIIERKNK